MQVAPTPQQIAEFLVKKHRPLETVTYGDRQRALRYICNGTTSLPTITIATRDRIEAEMKARARADDHRAEYEIAAASSFSPEPLDE